MQLQLGENLLFAGEYFLMMMAIAQCYQEKLMQACSVSWPEQWRADCRAVLDGLGCLAQIILIAGTRNVIRIKKQGCKRIRIEKQGCKWAFTIINEISSLPYNTNNRWLCRSSLLSFSRIVRECGRSIYVVLFASIISSIWVCPF